MFRRCCSHCIGQEEIMRSRVQIESSKPDNKRLTSTGQLTSPEATNISKLHYQMGNKHLKHELSPVDSSSACKQAHTCEGINCFYIISPSVEKISLSSDIYRCIHF